MYRFIYASRLRTWDLPRMVVSIAGKGANFSNCCINLFETADHFVRIEKWAMSCNKGNASCPHGRARSEWYNLNTNTHTHIFIQFLPTSSSLSLRRAKLAHFGLLIIIPLQSIFHPSLSPPLLLLPISPSELWQEGRYTLKAKCLAQKKDSPAGARIALLCVCVSSTVYIHIHTHTQAGPGNIGGVEPRGHRGARASERGTTHRFAKAMGACYFWVQQPSSGSMSCTCCSACVRASVQYFSLSAPPVLCSVGSMPIGLNEGRKRTASRIERFLARRGKFPFFKCFNLWSNKRKSISLLQASMCRKHIQQGSIAQFSQWEYRNWVNWPYIVFWEVRYQLFKRTCWVAFLRRFSSLHRRVIFPNGTLWWSAVLGCTEYWAAYWSNFSR